MPIYEFHCKNCDKKFSVPRYYSGENEDIPVCPHCGAKQAVRIYGNINVVFKGKGFYSTDEKKKEGADGPFE